MKTKSTNKKKEKKWQCEICNTIFSTKRGLCEDLAIHFEEASSEAEQAQMALDSLGVKDHYKFL